MTDEHDLPMDEAIDLARRCLGYTNHTSKVLGLFTTTDALRALAELGRRVGCPSSRAMAT